MPQPSQPSQPHPHQPAPVPSPFQKKKTTILSEVSAYDSPGYTDNSPKGTIDAEIIDLINEINAFDGYVTTSSCAGRVAVFVEGRATGMEGGGVSGAVRDGTGLGNGEQDEHDNMDDSRMSLDTVPASSKTRQRITPGGKGHGNKWLYVSHEPLSALPPSLETYHDLFGLTPASTTYTSPSPIDLLSTENNPKLTSPSPANNSNQDSQYSSRSKYKYPSNPRLIKLSFSPLILHILCSSLHTARPLLAAAINAGFRESGVQSLKILDREGLEYGGSGGSSSGTPGVMLAIRTAGCAFETVIGYVEEVSTSLRPSPSAGRRSSDSMENGRTETEADKHEGEVRKEIYRSVVSEEWLAVCVGIVNGRFDANRERKERLRGEIARIGRGGKGGDRNGHGHENGDGKGLDDGAGWEDKEVRRARKREEGLRRKREMDEKKETGDSGMSGMNGQIDSIQEIPLDDGTELGGRLFS